MRLTETFNKIKDLPDLPKDLFVLSLITLVGLGAFASGRLSALEEERKSELKIVQASPSLESDTKEGEGVPLLIPVSSGMYVGSRSGTTYHLPWCSGAQRIKEENKLWFATKEEAESKGYKPAANCKGI